MSKDYTESISVPFLVTDENITDIMDTASMTCGYWARWEESKGDHEHRQWNVAEDNESNDPNEWPRHTLTAPSLVKAIAKVADPRQQYCADYIADYVRNSIKGGDVDQGIDCGDIDGEAADVLVQVALFDKVVYG